MNERELINWIRQQGGTDGKDILVGPGDDCAVLAASDSPLLVTVDQVLDGVHVDIAHTGGRAAGRKAMARNLSDIAAMAGMPFVAVASVTLPKGDDALGREVYAGLRELAEAFDCPIVGGDVATWDNPLMISVTVLGKMPTGREPVLRSGARAGDAICVTGTLGNSWQCGRDLTFTPRLAEAAELVTRATPTAMIDLSDGLACDLRHVCDASGTGAHLQAGAIPLAPGATLAGALADGEDYELLFTLSRAEAEAVAATGLAGTCVTVLGEVTASAELLLTDANGTGPLPEVGWEHKA